LSRPSPAAASMPGLLLRSQALQAFFVVVRTRN
jgi:hypothetical protein